MTAMAEIRTSREGDIFCIVIDCDDEGSRLSNPMALALANALDAAGDCRVILIRGQGADFCLGRSLAPPPAGAGVNALDVLRDDAGPIIALYAAFARRSQPVVGAIQGRAWGIGLVLAAICDLSFITAQGSFALRELERGIPPCIAMAPLLDRIAAKALARLVYTASEADAAWAVAQGIASEVVPSESLDARAREAAEKLASFPVEAVAAVKRFLVHAPRGDESKAVQFGASLLANVLGSR